MNVMEGVEEYPDRWGQSQVWLHSCWSSTTKTQRQTSSPVLLQSLNPSIYCPTLKTDPALDTVQHAAVRWILQSLVIKQTWIWGFLYLSQCKGKKHAQSKLLIVNISPQCLVQETFLPVNWMMLAEPMWSLRPSLTWHEATILCCLSNILGKKINATWQHYIKSFCALIFLFCLCTFVWGVRSRSRGPGGAELVRTMWESNEETVHVVFSLQFLLWLWKRLHLHRSFHTATSSITADGLACIFCTSPQVDPWALPRWKRSK